MQELVKALVAFNQQVTNVTKNSKADRYRYADLAAVLDTVRQPLADCGLAVTQTFDDLTLVTTLWHVSGESISSRMVLPSLEARGMNSAQAMGSAISYSRRYSLLSILNLATEDDDAASTGHSPAQGHTERLSNGRPGNAPKAAPAPQPGPPALLVELVNEHGIPHETVRAAVQAFGYRTASEIPEEKISVFVGQLLERHAATATA